MALLRVLKDGVEVHSLNLEELGKPEISIGRSAEADIRLDDRAVGREHALFVVNSKGVSVQKKSKFGKMSVNGSEVAESVLKPGDVISIADYLVRIEPSEEHAVGSEPVATAVAENVPAAHGAEHIDEAPDLAVAEGATGQINLAEPAGLSGMENGLEGSAPALEAAPPADPLAAPADEMPQFPMDGANLDSGSMPGAEGEASAGGGDGMFVESERTAMIPQSKIVTKLEFKPEDANVEELVLQKAETSIGRGSNCDVVLNDKKASRKHLIIKRVGMNFVAKDLGSANGTFVNGVKISEQELAGDDVLRIGDTEFVFKAVSQEYFEQQQEFEGVEEQVPQEEAMAGGLMSMEGMDPNAGMPQEMMAPGMPGMEGALDPNQMQGLGQAATIPGLSAGPPKKQTLLEKFKAQPPLRKVIIVAGILGLLMFLSEEEPRKPTQPKKPQVVDNGIDAAFKALPPEKQQFVINTYQLALSLYTNQEYERALYEANKLLEVLPGGYKDAKDIKAYAQKAIDQLKAREEEKRRKEAEERLRAEVATLVSKAERLVESEKYDEAKLVFSQVLEKDPENPVILRLRQMVEDREAKLRAEEAERKEREFKRQQLVKTIREARDLLEQEKFYDAINKVADAPVIYAGDQALLDEAKQLIEDAKTRLKEKVAPHIQAGTSALSDGNFTAARDAFLKALEIDFKSTEAKDGLNKIRDILHEKSQRIYTEGIIAESLSDFKAAIAKFKECMDVSMPDDIYRGRCTRKYERYELLEQREAGDATGFSAGPAPASSDPRPPELPTPVEVDAVGEPEDAGSY